MERHGRNVDEKRERRRARGPNLHWDELYKIGLPGKLILSMIKCLLEVLFSENRFSGNTYFLQLPPAIRKTAIDYTIPIFYPDEITLFGQRGVGGGVDYLLYMKLFPPSVWALVISTILIFALGFLIIAMSGTNDFHDFTDSESFGVFNSAALSVMLLYQNQEYKILYKSTAARVCFLFASLVSYLIFTYFSSDLTATLTTASNIPPIKNFQVSFPNLPDQVEITDLSACLTQRVRPVQTAKIAGNLLRMGQDV